MKTLVIINESFAEMLVGKNSTLAYILAAAEFSEVFVQNLAQNFCVKISPNQAQILAAKYRGINQQIRAFASKIENVKVKDLIAEETCDAPEIFDKDLIIQRLEPMKAPFPPVGEKNIDEVLRDLRQKFPRHIFNCPLDLHDKELAEFADISTPTAEFNLHDSSLAKSIESMADAYAKIYQNGRKKIVIKPKNLAQSLGVFALDLETFFHSEFTHFHPELQAKDLVNKAPEILRLAQDDSGREDKITDLVKKLCVDHGEKFFRDQILVQPFLEGIRQGDIRANIIKNSQGDFEIAGFVFRKSLHEASDENFTTGFVSGGSTPRPIADLTESEQEDLREKSTKVLQILNGKLRKKYRDVIEVGADFILIGNGHEVLLGEINHHCPGLMPIAEAVGEENYEEGFFLVKKLIETCKH